uniref:(northern house mosquito) hypothetical protein n=1 Tax=Culex pipiens TaxID=7175 RepID=A0A8D8HZR8_CULPI
MPQNVVPHARSVATRATLKIFGDSDERPQRMVVRPARTTLKVFVHVLLLNRLKITSVANLVQSQTFAAISLNEFGQPCHEEDLSDTYGHVLPLAYLEQETLLSVVLSDFFQFCLQVQNNVLERFFSFPRAFGLYSINQRNSIDLDKFHGLESFLVGLRFVFDFNLGNLELGSIHCGKLFPPPFFLSAPEKRISLAIFKNCTALFSFQ